MAKKIKCELCGEKECKCRKEAQTKDRIKIYFCPKCRSKEVYHPLEIRNLYGIIPKWKCRKCGFESGMFPMISISKNELERLNKTKNLRNKHKTKKNGRRKQ